MSFLVLGLVALGLLVNILSLAFTLGRLRGQSVPADVPGTTATLVLPLSGRAESLDRLVAALGRQTLRPRRLIVSVESETDPAFARTHALASSADIPIEIVVAGLASIQAQKCRNQQAALERIDERDEAVVLLDGDIMPTDWWLATLVAPLADGSSDIVTGLRWQQVAEQRLGAHLVCMIDRAAFLLPRFKARITRVVWGGSVAVSRNAMLALPLGPSLARTISDDLSIVDAAKVAGLRIVTRRELLVPTPATHDLAGAWSFACRQYRIVHIYRPWLWRLAAATIAVRLAAWAIILAGMVDGGMMAWAALAMATLAVAKPFAASLIGRRLGLPDRPTSVALQMVLGLVQPLVDLFHASIIAGAAVTGRIVWGHVAYRIAGPYAIAVEGRTPIAG